MIQERIDVRVKLRELTPMVSCVSSSGFTHRSVIRLCQGFGGYPPASIPKLTHRALRRRVKALRWVFLVATFGLVACNDKPTPELLMSSVSIYAEPDVNDNSAIAVDLVIVYNNDLLGTIGKMSATKYFASSNQLLLDNPTLLDIWRWELVPGQIVQDFKPPQDKGHAFGAYVFANYLAPGDHRVKVPPDGAINIILSKKDLRILAAPGASDIKRGTTMTEASPAGATTVGILNKGPTQGVAPSCKKLTPEISQQLSCRPIVCPKVPASPGKPISIVAQPLPSLTKTPPCKYKQR